MGKIRWSSFLSNPNDTTSIELQERDFALLDALYQYSPMSTHHMVQILSKDGTYQYEPIRKRRRKLLNKGILICPELQRVIYIQTGRKDSHIHFLGDRALPLLEERFGYITPKTHFTEQGKGRISFDHDLAITDIYVRFTVGCRARGITYLKRKDFIESSVSPQALSKYPFKAKNWELAQLKIGESYLKPDDIFAFQRDKKLLFFLEVNRNTEPNESAFQRKTVKSTLQKYIAVYHGKHHTKAYGVDNFRVLFVTTSDAQIYNLLKIIESLQFTPEIFHFTTFKAIKETDTILDIEWHTNKGNLRKLI